MTEEQLDIRDKTSDELIDLYDAIARTTLDDAKDFQSIHTEERFARTN